MKIVGIIICIIFIIAVGYMIFEDIKEIGENKSDKT